MPTIKLAGEQYIYERISADGRLTSYQVKIRRKGFPQHNTSFDDLDEAGRFVRKVLGDQDRGHKVDRLAGHRNTVGDVIDGAITALETGRRRVKGGRANSTGSRPSRETMCCCAQLPFRTPPRTCSRTGSPNASRR